MKKSANRKEWAARSAIQKAIRRSDTGMLHAAFAILWEKDRNWLVWRLPVLAIEEVWQYAGDAWKLFADFQKAPDQELFAEAASELLETLCRSYKDHSAYLLSVLWENSSRWNYQGPSKEPYACRFSSLVRMLEYRHKHGDEAVARSVMLKAQALDNADIEYATRGCMQRFLIPGGMAGDRIMALIAGFLCLTSFNGPPPLAPTATTTSPEDWPWYVYDQHTTIGKKAFTRAAQRLAMHPLKLQQTTFRFTGGVRTPIDKKAFWPQEYERVMHKIAPHEQTLWEQRIKPVIKEEIINGIKQENIENEIRLPFLDRQ
ncbi:MAG: hypothetical protein WC124_07060 [Desulfoplanes sp.]